MHQPMMEGLEAYLSGQPNAEFEQHMAGCAECRQIAESIAEQTKLVRLLRSPIELADAELAPDFYSRVMERIDAQRPVSIWESFLEPLFARRLVYASLALLVILSGIFITAETPGEMYPEVALTDTHVTAVQPDQANHDEVLVQLTTYRSGE